MNISAFSPLMNDMNIHFLYLNLNHFIFFMRRLRVEQMSNLDKMILGICVKMDKNYICQ